MAIHVREKLWKTRILENLIFIDSFASLGGDRRGRRAARRRRDEAGVARRGEAERRRRAENPGRARGGRGGCRCGEGLRGRVKEWIE